ncbi:Uncharacterised protein [Vibrio cholerae]|nr:Uncharacterised protein [Vibrio cholerae]CSC79270.1 Uncharacterised protein [Vibrio cholerae]
MHGRVFTIRKIFIDNLADEVRWTSLSFTHL